MTPRFDHEKLAVYRRALEFVAWLTELPEWAALRHPARTQLDRAATSIPLNIAEGNGRHTAADRCHFFDIARGSALECAAALDVLVAARVMPSGAADRGKDLLREIVAMLVGLIRCNADDRLHEEAPPWGRATEKTAD